MQNLNLLLQLWWMCFRHVGCCWLWFKKFFENKLKLLQKVWRCESWLVYRLRSNRLMNAELLFDTQCQCEMWQAHTNTLKCVSVCDWSVEVSPTGAECNFVSLLKHTLNRIVSNKNDANEKCCTPNWFLIYRSFYWFRTFVCVEIFSILVWINLLCKIS